MVDSRRERRQMCTAAIPSRAFGSRLQFKDDTAAELVAATARIATIDGSASAER
jgi:hypothetical protein